MRKSEKVSLLLTVFFACAVFVLPPQAKPVAVVLAVISGLATLVAVFTPDRPPNADASRRAIFVMRFAPTDLKHSRTANAYVQNIGDGNARNVDVGPIGFGMYEFKFGRIPFIQANGGSALLVVQSGKTTEGFNVLEIMRAMSIPTDSWLKLAAKDHLSDLTIPIPIAYLNDNDKRVPASPLIMHVSSDLVVSMHSSERPAS